MIEWTDAEHIAIAELSDHQSVLKTALDKFLKSKRDSCREMCAMHMATVPRNPEFASDYAAKAQVYEEFWILLAETLAS